LTFESDQDSVKVNQQARYLGQRSFSSTDIGWTHRQTHTNTRTSTWTTKVMGKNEKSSYNIPKKTFFDLRCFNCGSAR